MWEDLCFWAQQAAELAIKAVYQQTEDLGLIDGQAVELIVTAEPSPGPIAEGFDSAPQMMRRQRRKIRPAARDMPSSVRVAGSGTVWTVTGTPGTFMGVPPSTMNWL